MSEIKGNEEKKVEGQRQLYEFVKESVELPEKPGKYWIRYKHRTVIQYTGSFFDGWKFTHHNDLEWLKPASLTPIPSINGLVEELGAVSRSLYNALPTGEISAFDLTTIIKAHLTDLDNLMVKYSYETPTKVESISDKEDDK